MNASKFLIYFLSLTLGLISASCGSSKKAISYQLGLEKGDDMMYRQTQESTTRINVMGMDQTTTNKQELEYQLRVTDIAENKETKIETTFKNIKMDQNSAMSSLSYDSKNPEKSKSNPTAEIFDNMLGQTIEIVIDQQGNVKQVQGADALIEKMFAGMDQPEMADMKSLMKTQFGGDVFAQSIAQLGQFYPDKAVKTGDSWTKVTKLTTPMAMEVITDYTLTGRKKGVSTISFTSTIATDPNAEGMSFGGMSMKYDLKGKQTGTMLVNEKSGWVNNSSGNLTMDGNMNITGAMGNMSTKMSLEQMVKFEKIR